MLLLRVLLSAVTLFGGHVLNRRLDRVLQVFSMLALLGIAYLVLPSLLLRASRTHLMLGAFHTSALLLLVIALVSAGLTWKDAKAPAPPPLSPSSRLAGGTVSLFGLLAIGFATMLVLASPAGRRAPEVAEHSPPSPSPPTSFGSRMHASTYLGGSVQYDELRQPPTGPHPLRGRLLMAAQPVASASVELILNGAFRSDALATHADGEFEISLPAGPWTVNQVTVTSWPDAPAGKELLLFSEHEPPKQAGYYSRTLPGNPPLRIALPTSPGFEPPTFELREAIAVQWPAASSSIPLESDEAPPVADPATDAVSWSAVPGASEYEIQLRSVERAEQSMSMSTILLRRQSGTALRLADLPKQPRESAEPDEYSVVVYAFDANGQLLSQSSEGFDYYAFLLDGETRLAEERGVHSTRSLPDNSEHLRNMERLSLVQSLLEYQQLDAARAILKEVTGDAPPGRKAAMQGAIEAMTGNCAAAIPLLDQADKEGGLGCAPLKYREMCSSAR